MHDDPLVQRFPTPTLTQSASCWHEASKVDTSIAVHAPASGARPASVGPFPPPMMVVQSAVFTAVVHVPWTQLAAAQSAVHGSHAGAGQYVPSEAQARPTDAATLLGHTSLAVGAPSSEGDVEATAPPHAATRTATPTVDNVTQWHNGAHEKRRADMFGR